MQQLSAQLSSCQLQLQLASEGRADAEAEVAALQASLLQQTAIAEAAQGQLAAAALTQQVQALLVPAAVTPQATSSSSIMHGRSPPAAVQPSGLCADLAAVVHRQLAASPIAGTDPKAQRIQELRAALAAALVDAGSAAQADAGATAPAAALAARGSSRYGNHGEPTGPSTATGGANVPAALADDPKVKRLHEVVGALMAAASQLPAGPTSQELSAGNSGGSHGSLAVDPKQQRIQELRAALATALQERDELRQQLQGGPQQANSTLMQAEQQLGEAQQQLIAAQVR